MIVPVSIAASCLSFIETFGEQHCFEFEELQSESVPIILLYRPLGESNRSAYIPSYITCCTSLEIEVGDP